MEEGSNVYTVEAQDDVEVQDEEAIQSSSEAKITVECHDLGEEKGATSKSETKESKSFEIKKLNSIM